MLAVEQKKFYDEQGYVLIEGLLGPDEAMALRAEMHHLSERIGRSDGTWDSVRDQGTTISHCHDVQFRSAMVTRFLTDPRLTGIVSDIIGPNVQLHHTKMFIKPPENGSPFPMHQDFHYFPHRDHSMIAVILHLDDAPEEKGCLRVYPGTHRLGPLECEGSDHHLSPERFPIEGALPIPAKAGDAIFFNYLTVHGSGLNRSDEPRTTLLIQLRDPTDKPLNDRHSSRGQGMMLAGVDPTAGAFHFAWEEEAV